MAQTASTPRAADGAAAAHPGKLWALAVGSIGVVYGDIGTSPLYAFKEAVTAAKEHGTYGPDAILGTLSVMIWALFLIVTIKYVTVLLRATHRTRRTPTRFSARNCGRPAPVAQGIEHRFPKPCVGSSNLPGGTNTEIQLRNRKSCTTRNASRYCQFDPGLNIRIRLYQHRFNKMWFERIH